VSRRLGTVEEFPTKVHATRAAESARLEINTSRALFNSMLVLVMSECAHLAEVGRSHSGQTWASSV
jgi:hypothetical protein